jgi:nicotinamidase/pyrazinamidase
MFAIDPTHDILIAVDIQNDFCPGGALAIAGGDEVVAPVNRLFERFAHAVLTQDWHPANHSSFASNHANAKPFATIEMPYGRQTLWPNHCVQGTFGAAFVLDLEIGRAELIIRKGFRREIDSYSTFFENDRKTPTGLAGFLRERSFSRIFLAGLATDFCVSYSALDAIRLGFETFVILDACRGIDLENSLAAARRAWGEAGVRVIETAEL